MVGRNLIVYYILRGEKRKVSVIWLLPRKTTRIKWFTIMLRKKKIETILFETKGLTSIGSVSRESTPTSWLCKKRVGGLKGHFLNEKILFLHSRHILPLPSLPASEYSLLFYWWDEVALIESVLVFAEKVRLYLTSRQKLPAFWDLQEAEFLCFLSSQ